ncbi:DUF4376 domain-containing protein [Undibacterium macrobrachii]|uniref:DUF4376 domain-containing protein n=1 Tax=Undibacterium macrobrachii TaxID=1119058 RepID=A0ABQ2X662_9BURK|nr:DUF4376 domain-containing protein [Undibacterium macrobrachii]GGX01392.1 hypothetical protein GCM10011282_04140 [Undibacterium macrobrachii]
MKHYLIESSSQLAIWCGDDAPILSESFAQCGDELFLCYSSSNSYVLQASEIANFAQRKYKVQGGVLIVDPAWVEPVIDLAPLKAAKNKQINEWRLHANETSFTYEGHHIAADLMSKIDIIVTNGEITNQGAMPVNWVGGWKTMVNSVYVEIPDVDTWKQFHSALFNQGLTNFTHAQMLKAQLEAATTEAQINAITW